MAETTAKTTAKSSVKTSVVNTKPANKKPIAAKPSIARATQATKKRTVAVPKQVVTKDTAAKPSHKATDISGEQRYRMVAEAAYYRAESNQFKNDPLRNWVEAEGAIAALLSGSK